MVGVQLQNKFVEVEYPFISNCNRNVGFKSRPANSYERISFFFLNWALRLPSSSSVRVHPSRLVLSVPLYRLNCGLARMQVGRCEWRFAFLPGCLGPNFAASPAVA